MAAKNPSRQPKAGPRELERKTQRALGFDDALALLADRPGVERSTSYGTAAIKVRGKLLARLKEDGETLVVRCEPDGREILIASAPGTFFVTDHYEAHPWVLVALPKIQKDALRAVLEDAFALVSTRAR